MVEADFQRARRPQQIAERRALILQVARDMLGEHRLADISLRELSTRVGLAKSNVVRYFESREGIYLELLDVEWKAWLDAVHRADPTPRPALPFATEFDIADTLTDTLVARPLLCELFGSLASVLEHNVSLEYARNFRTRSRANALTLRTWLLHRLPDLDDDSATHFVGAVSVIAGGLWSYERPSDNVAQIANEIRGIAAQGFETNLRAGLRAHLVGVATLARAGDPAT